MNNQTDNLTIGEQKMAYVMGYDFEGPTLVEKLITQWRVFMAYRHIHANKIPLQVFLHTVSDQDVKSFDAA